MRQDGREGRKERDDVHHRHIQIYAVVTYTVIYARKLVSANDYPFPLSIYRTAWPASQTSLQLDFELRTKRYTF